MFTRTHLCTFELISKKLLTNTFLVTILSFGFLLLSNKGLEIA